MPTAFVEPTVAMLGRCAPVLDRVSTSAAGVAQHVIRCDLVAGIAAWKILVIGSTAVGGVPS
jgi:hypothetical protein